MKLEKFTKNKKQKKVIIGAIVGLILLVGGITLYRTFALYEEKKEFDVLKGKVSNFSGILSITVKVGDYVEMTPTSTSYIIPKSSTGYSSDQTINPSELNLWRVINIKDDGTIEMVSEFVSSAIVCFYGAAGYKNSVGTLNTIAAQYANEEYTIATRYMGYNGQTEVVSATASASCGTTGTVNNNKEKNGCGDVLHKTDTTLVSNAIGTLQANKVNEASGSIYYLASRVYTYLVDSATPSNSYWDYGIRLVSVNAAVARYTMYRNFFNTTNASYSNNCAIQKPSVRPIVTLKSDVKADGSGTSEDPYKLL